MKQIEKAAEKYALECQKEEGYPSPMYDSCDAKDMRECAFKSGAEWQAKQSPWISVEMAIPKDDSPGVVQVITVDGKEGEMAARRVMYNIYPYIKTGYVTHWRPIPALPKGGEG